MFFSYLCFFDDFDEFTLILRLLKQGQMAFKAAIAEHEQNSIYMSLTTTWPMWHLLDQIMLEEPLPPYEEPENWNKHSLSIHYCGRNGDVARDLHTEGGKHGWVIRSHVSGDDGVSCREWHQQAAQDSIETFTLVISPFTYSWAEDQSTALLDILPEIISTPEINIVGFPTVNSTSYWDFPTGHTRRRIGGKITYEDYPSGYYGWQGSVCLASDVTSGTRLYRGEVWREISTIFSLDESDSSWMVDVDFQKREVFTCMSTQPLFEDDYKDYVELSIRQARRYLVEVVAFTPTNINVLCGLTYKTGDYEPPFCFRRDVHMIMVLLRRYSLEVSSDDAVNLHHLQKWGAVAKAWSPIILRTSLDEYNNFLRTAHIGGHFSMENCGDFPGQPCIEIRSSVTMNAICRIYATSREDYPKGLTIMKEDVAAGVLPGNVIVFYCSIDERLADEVGSLCRDHNWECVIAHDRCYERLQEIDSESNYVLIISPYILDFDQIFIHHLFRHVKPTTQVIGMPHYTTVHHKLLHDAWHYPARRIRREYWKLIFEHPPPECEGECCTSHTTSGTRLYSPAVLPRIFPASAEHNSTVDSFIPELDMAGHYIHLTATTCNSPDAAILIEENYLNHAAIEKSSASHHRSEYFQFTPSNVHEVCQPLTWFDILKFGLVGGYCFRRDVERTLRSIRNWWVASGEDRFMVPEEGTMLALWRNGKRGMFPWDSDFDAKLYSFKDIPIPNVTTHGAHCFSNASQTEVHHYAGCGHQQYSLVRRPNITHHIGDLYISGNQNPAEYKWTTTLMGVEVRLSQSHLWHAFFERYRKPIEKYYGDGEVLHCKIENHPACTRKEY